MPQVLIASDSPEVRAEVRSVLSGPQHDVREVADGHQVLAAAAARLPDLVVLDLELGNKGAVANLIDLRLEAAAGRLGRTATLLLLDRRADVFLARRAGADGYLVKPLDPIRLRKAVTALLEGGSYEDPSYQPVTVGRDAGSPGAG